MTITLSRSLKNASMVAGDSETVSGTATDSAGTAVNLTGYTIAYQITDGTRTRVSKTTDDGSVTVTVAASGTFSVALEPEDTATLDAGTYRHRVVLTSGSGAVSTPLRGRLRLVRDTLATTALTPDEADVWDTSGAVWDEATDTWDAA